jgi:hypothetical protein
MSSNTSDASCRRTLTAIFSGLFVLFVVLIAVARALVY